MPINEKETVNEKERERQLNAVNGRKSKRRKKVTKSLIDIFREIRQDLGSGRTESCYF